VQVTIVLDSDATAIAFVASDSVRTKLCVAATTAGLGLPFGREQEHEQGGSGHFRPLPRLGHRLAQLNDGPQLVKAINACSM
jgi:hypothetical protein